MKIGRKTIISLMVLVLTSLSASAQKSAQVNTAYLYLYVDKLPKFKGGTDKLKSFLKQNLKWPDNSVDIRGVVLLSFIVSDKGDLTNITIEKSLSKAFDDEAIRVIKLMPKWIPGKLGNNNVWVKMYFPINFITDD